MQKRSEQGAQSMGQARKVDSVFASLSSANSRQSGPESKNCAWQCVKDFLCEGDLESAYEEALCSIDELVLIELIESTGPVLESLSSKTASDVLSTLASYFLEQRFTNSIIPWLQQVVDLSTINGPDYIVLSAKTRREFFCAIQEAINMEFSNPAERRSISQLAMKLRQLWGKSS
ncbi:TORTIFOLIA1-LIKE PROTEIN 2 [Salix koriyanagi]|nr:TORTIFOLIA1-LIKE PROTEIN 2 [Salix koriyanagi]